MSRSLLTFAILFAFASSARTQSFPLPPLLVTWAAPGALELPTSPDWQFQQLKMFDHDNRPVVLYKNSTSDVYASFIIFPNLSGKPTAEGCRADVIQPLKKQYGNAISQRKDADLAVPAHEPYASTSYLLTVGTEPPQRNTFTFAGDKDLCTELHLSTLTPGPAGEAALQLALKEFKPRLGYITSARELVSMANYLFATSPEEAAPYYGEALPKITPGPQALAQTRITTDQLVISLGMSGHLDAARHFAEQAIKTDPDYPLNYYNLACADAEQGNASAARIHLEQAFARKANVLPGESLPDPNKDDSLLKLKSNQAFWAYAQTLSR